ncbi:MAG: peptidoglycan DD-metalloendopeptidase family protein [Elusimicrobiota bacterium]|jgi:septal ring factor EnvC (AmiA/AmiB activator)|nr:peptidoglycan DD-metalloendopeptidase family protein [Elusimicrobiota bacterium]
MEKILKLALAAVLLLCGQCIFAASQEDLAALERQAKEKETQLKKYKEQEARLERELKNLTKRERDARLQSLKLSTDIEVFRTQGNKAMEHKTLMEDNLPLWQRVVRGELENYVIEDILASSYYDSGGAAARAASAAFINAHMAFLSKLDSEARRAGDKIEDIRSQSRRLLAKKDALETSKENIKDDYQKKKGDLEDARQRALEAARNLKELKESAAQMQAILKEAEARRKETAKKTGAPLTRPAPDVKKNTLMWPVSGKIISRFGREYNAQLKTYIFRDGVKIAAPAGTPVEAVKDGGVIYAGPFRSYGNVVILDHGGGFFTIYGFLSEIKTQIGQDLGAGQVLGLSGRDGQGSAMGSGADALYFEVRIGTAAEDPERWLE